MLKVFVSIMLPMVLPSLTALFVMNFVTVWNDGYSRSYCLRLKEAAG